MRHSVGIFVHPSCDSAENSRVARFNTSQSFPPDSKEALFRKLRQLDPGVVFTKKRNVGYTEEKR
jgi:hypothetical protein